MGLLYTTSTGETRSLSPIYYQQQITAIEQQEAQKRVVAEQQRQPTQPQTPSWKETTVAGQVLTGKTKSPLGSFLEIIGFKQQAEGLEQWYKEQEWWLHPFGTKQASIEISAGVISYPESTVRSIGGLVGRPSEAPPTYMGGIIGKALGRPGEWEEVQKLPLTYHVGGFIGGAGESIVAGYALGKAWGGLKKVAPEAIKQPLYEAKEAVRFSRAAKGVHEAKLLVYEKVPIWKITQPFTKRLAIGEVAIPTFERYGIKELEAEAVAWGAMQTSRMGGVMLTRYAAESTSQRVLPHLISRAGMISIGFLRGPEGIPVREATFTPLVSQTQLTRMGVQPYIPRMAPTLARTGKIGTTLIGVGVTAIPRAFQLEKPQQMKREVPIAIPKIFESTFTYEREKFRPQTLLRQEPKQRERVIPILKLAPFQMPRQEQSPIQIPILKELQTQKQAQALTFKFPTPQITKPTPIYPHWPRLGGGERGRRQRVDLFGRWYQKQHRIKTPAEVASVFGFKMRKGKEGFTYELD